MFFIKNDVIQVLSIMLFKMAQHVQKLFEWKRPFKILSTMKILFVF
jgi:hypothetical protein